MSTSFLQKDALFALPNPVPAGQDPKLFSAAFADTLLERIALFLGYTLNENRSEEWKRLIYQHDMEAYFTFVYQALCVSDAAASSGVPVVTLRFRGPDDKYRTVGCKAFVPQTGNTNSESAAPPQIFLLISDVTEERNREERLRLLESVMATTTDVVLITEAEPIDRPGPEVVYVNAAFSQMTGYAPEDILGKTPRLLQGPQTQEETRQFIRKKLKAWKGFRAELRNYKKDGTAFWVELNVQPVADETGWFTHWVAIQRDITARRKLEIKRERQLLQARERADTDGLTGLLNHRAFHERLIKVSQSVAQTGTKPETGVPAPFVVLMDLDNFKFFNEAYGHLIGDEVLRRIAHAFSELCTAQDVLARMGGDEFALLGFALTESEAAQRMARIKRGIAQLNYTPPGDDAPIPLSLSCGMAFFGSDSDGFQPSDVLGRADERLMRDKVGDQDYHLERLREELKQSADGFAMLDALVTAVDNKDRYTRRHSENVLFHTVAMAMEIGLPSQEIRDLQVAALLHDVGKIGVPDRVLRLPGRLNETDYQTIKQHAAMGALLVGAHPPLRGAVDAVRFHHERWDGAGYPDALQAEAIPQAARLLAVADSYSAMTADRPYRKGLTKQEALSRLQAGAGSQWDAEYVGILQTVLQKTPE